MDIGRLVRIKLAQNDKMEERRKFADEWVARAKSMGAREARVIITNAKSINIHCRIASKASADALAAFAKSHEGVSDVNVSRAVDYETKASEFQVYVKFFLRK
jgi:hypothetical protein